MHAFNNCPQTEEKTKWHNNGQYIPTFLDWEVRIEGWDPSYQIDVVLKFFLIFFPPRFSFRRLLSPALQLLTLLSPVERIFLFFGPQNDVILGNQISALDSSHFWSVSLTKTPLQIALHTRHYRESALHSWESVQIQSLNLNSTNTTSDSNNGIQNPKWLAKRPSGINSILLFSFLYRSSHPLS